MLIGGVSAGAAKQHRGGGRHTVERLNLRKKLLPALVLLVHAAEVGDEERFLRIGLALCTEVESVHDAVPKMDIRVATMKRRQPWDRDLVIVMTLRVLEGIGRVVRRYDMGRGIESVYESTCKILFVLRAAEGRRA